MIYLISVNANIFSRSAMISYTSLTCSVDKLMTESHLINENKHVQF